MFQPLLYGICFGSIEAVYSIINGIMNTLYRIISVSPGSFSVSFPSWLPPWLRSWLLPMVTMVSGTRIKHRNTSASSNTGSFPPLYSRTKRKVFRRPGPSRRSREKKDFTGNEIAATSAQQRNTFGQRVELK